MNTHSEIPFVVTKQGGSLATVVVPADIVIKHKSPKPESKKKNMGSQNCLKDKTGPWKGELCLKTMPVSTF